MGGSIPIQNRFIGGCLIFILGSQLIYYGMKFNGSARFKSPVWFLVKGVHDLLSYGVLTAVVGVLVLFVVIPVLVAILPEPKVKEAKPAQPIPKELEELRQSDQEEIKSLEIERERIEERRKLEKQRKLEIIKHKRERSAKDAAHAGLDDFL